MSAYLCLLKMSNLCMVIKKENNRKNDDKNKNKYDNPNENQWKMIFEITFFRCFIE